MTAILPSAVLVEVEFTAGVWTDIASSHVAGSIEIRVGRESAASDVQPGVMTLLLDNATGEWTPDNPTSARYPNWIEGKRIRVRVTKSATTYVRFVGRITSIVPDFPDDPGQSKVQVTAVDLLGDLQRIKMRQWGVDRKARLTPRMWVLDDTVARAGARAVASGANRLTVRRTAASGSIDFSSTSDLDVDGTSYVAMTSGRGLWHATAGFSDITGTVDRYFGGYFKLTEGSYGTIITVSDGPITGSGDWTLIEYTASGIRARSSLFTGGYVTPPADFGWLRIEGRWVDSSGSFVLKVTSVTTEEQVTDSTALVSYHVLNCLSIGGSMSLSAARVYVDDEADLFTDVFGTTTLTERLTFFGSNVNLSSLSATAAWTSTPTPDTSTVPASSERSAFEVLLDVARSQSGLVYHDYSTDATQTIKLVSSTDSRPTTVALTVDAELDLVGGPTLTRRIDDYVSTARVASTTDEVQVYDSTPGAVVGAASVDVSTVNGSEDWLQARAEDAIAQGSSSRLTVSQMNVDLAGAVNDLYAAWFAVTPGERVRLSNLPSAYFGVTYMDGYVEGWTERPSINDYTVTFDLSPADAPTEGRWDTDRWGWGDGVCTLSGSLTSSATSLTLTWTGTATMSTSAGDYPLDIDVNGERITLPSAPAGGTSPRTFTGVTRGAAPTVARAHASAEPVDIWNAFRWAM